MLGTRASWRDVHARAVRRGQGRHQGMQRAEQSRAERCSERAGRNGRADRTEPSGAESSRAEPSGAASRPPARPLFWWSAVARVLNRS